MFSRVKGSRKLAYINGVKFLQSAPINASAAKAQKFREALGSFGKFSKVSGMFRNFRDLDQHSQDPPWIRNTASSQKTKHA